MMTVVLAVLGGDGYVEHLNALELIFFEKLCIQLLEAF